MGAGSWVLRSGEFEEHWRGALEGEKEHKGNFTTNRRNSLFYQHFSMV